MANLTQEEGTDTSTSTQSTIIVNTTQLTPSNGVGTAGFVLALIGLFLSWIPVLGWMIWFLGLILSFCGIFKTPKGLAITGLIISLIDFIVLVAMVGTIASILG